MNLKYRQDGRTLAQFKKDIKNRTAKEAFLSKVFEQELLFRGHNVILEDYGTDNSGELVKEVGNTIDKLTTSDQERLQAKKK